MAAVRGIGVAVITRTSGTRSPWPASRRAARCSTPNRCCSSMTTTPSDRKLTLLLDQRMGADDQVDRPVVQAGEQPGPLGAGRPVGQQLEAQGPLPHEGRVVGHGEVGQQVPQAEVVLLGQDLGRRHQRALVAALHGRRAGRSTATTVLPEPTSPCRSRCIGNGAAEVGLDLGDDPLLGRRSAGTAGARGRRGPAARRGRARCPASSAPAPACGAPAPPGPGTARRRRGGAGPCARRPSTRAGGCRASAGSRSTKPCSVRSAGGTGSAMPRGSERREDLGDPRPVVLRVDAGLLGLRVDRHDPPGLVARHVEDRVL